MTVQPDARLDAIDQRLEALIRQNDTLRAAVARARLLAIVALAFPLVLVALARWAPLRIARLSADAIELRGNGDDARTELKPGFLAVSSGGSRAGFSTGPLSALVFADGPGGKATFGASANRDDVSVLSGVDGHFSTLRAHRSGAGLSLRGAGESLVVLDADGTGTRASFRVRQSAVDVEAGASGTRLDLAQGTGPSVSVHARDSNAGLSATGPSVSGNHGPTVDLAAWANDASLALRGRDATSALVTSTPTIGLVKGDRVVWASPPPGP